MITVLLQQILDLLSDHFPVEHHSFTQHRAENHLDVLDKGVVSIVITVQTYFIWIDYIVIIPQRDLLISHFVKVKVIVKVSNQRPNAT